MPITATRSVGLTPNCTSGLNTVIPPHNNGPADSGSMPGGSGTTLLAAARTLSAKPP